MTNKHWPMQAGEKLNRNPNEPVVALVSSGKNSYLWVGNDQRDTNGRLVDGFCFATMHGPANLRAMAKAILAEVGDKP